MTKQIPLTQDKFALVDDEDYGWLSQWKWYAHKDRNTYYARRGVWRKGKYTAIKMHRIILNAPSEMECDHINGNGLDNRRCNLRLATRAQNQQNKPKRGISVSQFKGVKWAGKKWRACIRVNGPYIHIGCYETEKEAARAYNEAAMKYHGEFACLNEV